MSAISDLLEDIDERWQRAAAGRIDLHILGASALILQAGYDRATKDSDVLETHAIQPDIRKQLLALAGKDTPLARKHGVYVDPVPRALPFLPQNPLWHPQSGVNARLSHFEVFVLDVLDVVTSKLFRFSANDRADIDAMIARELVPHERLLARFRSALDLFTHDARSSRLPECIDNFHTVERDSFGVEETEISLRNPTRMNATRRLREEHEEDGGEQGGPIAEHARASRTSRATRSLA